MAYSQADRTSGHIGPTRSGFCSAPFGYFSDKEVDALIEEQSVEADPDKRKALVQKANKITSDKVASIFLFHPANILVHSTKIDFPKQSRIPGLVDLDRVSFKA